MNNSMVKVNGVEISPEMAKFIADFHNNEGWYNNVMSDYLDFLIDSLEGSGIQVDFEETVKKLLLDMKGVKDTLKRLDKIVCKLEIDN